MATLNSLEEFSVLLLSAGRGYRIGKIGKKIPKSLIRINSKTILSRIISYLILKGIKEVNIVVGYKYKQIVKELNCYRGLKVNYIKIKDYVNNGSSYSWFKFRDLWNKKKKPLLIMHTDIIFDNKYIDNIIKSNKKNIIGVKKEKKIKLKNESYVVELKKDMQITKIGLNREIKKPYGEMICINKFSAKVANKIFKFMNKYFKIYGSTMTWEIPINDFITKNKSDKIYTLKNQFYDWVNVNTVKDLTKAKKIFKN